jgi:predicted  nucleic acid-binding Zn-ribbon protein
MPKSKKDNQEKENKFSESQVMTLLENMNDGIQIIAEGQTALSWKVDNLETRFDNLEIRFDNLETRFDNFETRFDNFQKEMYQFRDTAMEEFDRINQRFNSVENRLNKIEAEIKKIKNKPGANTDKKELMARIEFLEKELTHLKAKVE